MNCMNPLLCMYCMNPCNVCTVLLVGEVAGGSLAAVSTLYIALENSSKILAKNMANNTVMIVSHK